MATTATAISDKQLEAELRQLQDEATSIRKKLDDDTRKLEAAHTDRERIIDGIARGTVQESEAPQNKEYIEQLQIRIEGNNRLLTANRKKLNELGQEIGRRQAAAARIAREKEFSELQEKGEAAANKILEQLTRLVAEDVPAFDAIRRKLGAEFRDLGGEAIAVRLREMLWKPPHPSEALHNPEVHLRRLFDQGWELANKPGPSYESFRAANGEFQAVPGGELSLTVCSMRSKR
jgi:hypothetical protein